MLKNDVVEVLAKIDARIKWYAERLSGPTENSNKPVTGTSFVATMPLER